MRSILFLMVFLLLSLEITAGDLITEEKWQEKPENKKQHQLIIQVNLETDRVGNSNQDARIILKEKSHPNIVFHGSEVFGPREIDQGMVPFHEHVFVQYKF